MGRFPAVVSRLLEPVLSCSAAGAVGGAAGREGAGQEGAPSRDHGS